VAAVLNDVEHAVEKLRVVITALIAEQGRGNQSRNRLRQ
jgi:hypothetical protein